MNPKKKILILSGCLLTVAAVVGGTFFVQKSSNHVLNKTSIGKFHEAEEHTATGVVVCKTEALQEVFQQKKEEVLLAKQDQLDFMLEQNGKNLSGGQKQRLSIARALVKKPEILILDDSSSALDFATDAKLRKAVHNLEGNTTTFLVSQRIAGIRQADQILVLGNGTLEGNGTHDELMKTCEVYREIYFSQFPEERAAYNNESGVIA